MDAVRSVARQDAYVLEMDEGESWTIPGTNSSLRFIMDEESGPFALIHSRGNPDDAVPPHFHNEAVDTWLVLQGALKVWAGETGRVLSAGDFAFVPPKVTHSYQVIEPHTEFIGVIHPSQWVSFFRAIGERNSAPGPYPSNDTRPFPVERFMKAIKDGHDVVPQFGHKFKEVLHDWSDSKVPETPEPYFLKAHRGPRYALGGQTCAPICSFGATDSKFSMSFLEVHRSTQKNELFRSITFKEACQVIYVQTGSMKVTIGGEEHVLQTGDSAYVPPGSSFRILPGGAFARALVCSSGPGLESLFKAGKSIQGVIGSEESEVDSSLLDAVKSAAQQANIEVEMAQANGH